MSPLSPSKIHSHLSPKAKVLSTSPNFNPFSPLSPHQHDRTLFDEDFTEGEAETVPARGGASAVRREYTRSQLLRIAAPYVAGCSAPLSMRPFTEWYRLPDDEALLSDPAIASIGPGPGRRPGGYAEGFGRGGGIGGKGLHRGGRQAGHANNDGRHRRADVDANGGLPIPSKETFGGPMGKFSVRPAGERTRPVADDQRGTKDEWRRGGAPGQPHRQERRQWSHQRDNEHGQPAWMDDQSDVDPAIVQTTSSTPFEFGTGEDPIAAHKRMMKASSSEAGSHKLLVPFFSGDSGPVTKPAKTPKQFNAADYLLPAKSAVPVAPKIMDDGNEQPSHSRFSRFFGSPSPSGHPADTANDIARQPLIDAYATRPPIPLPEASRSPPIAQAPPHIANLTTSLSQQPAAPFPHSAVSPPPHQPQDHAARLMGMLTSRPPQRASASGMPEPAHSPSPPPGLPSHRSNYASPPPTAQSAHPPPPPGMPFSLTSETQRPRPHGSMPPEYMMQPYPPSLQGLNLGPVPTPRPGPQQHVPPLHGFPQHPNQFSGSAHPDFARPPFPHGLPLAHQQAPHQVPSHQLPSRQQNMLATLYGNPGPSGGPR